MLRLLEEAVRGYTWINIIIIIIIINNITIIINITIINNITIIIINIIIQAYIILPLPHTVSGLLPGEFSPEPFWILPVLTLLATAQQRVSKSPRIAKQHKSRPGVAPAASCLVDQPCRKNMGNMYEHL